MALRSPCTGVCRLDAGRVCEGCGRSIDEIIGWLEAPDARKHEILAAAARRRAARGRP